MKTHLTYLCLITALIAPAAAQAEAALEPGAFVRLARNWDEASNSFRPGAPVGEENGCWQVVAVEGAVVRLHHVSGVIKPWWSSSPIQPGATDEWFDSDSFRARNPGAAPLTQIRGLIENVPSCPASK